jgi:anti-sigma regulatory factor (Ser/Thr protein kinase)/PAS domain-containing protein
VNGPNIGSRVEGTAGRFEKRRRGVARAFSWRLALTYAVAATLWIVGSDYLIAHIGLPIRVEEVLSSVKGILFVLVTAGILYVLSFRAMYRLATTEEQYHRLFENATEGIMVLCVERDADGEVSDLALQDANPELLRQSRLTPEQALGRHLDSPDLPPVLKPYFDLVRIATPEGGPYEVQTPDGSFYLVTVFQIDEDLCAVGTLDVTDRRRAREALQRQEEEIRQAYVDVLDAVTGGKLVLVTEQELRAELGTPLMPPRDIDDPSKLTAARGEIIEAAEAVLTDDDKRSALMSAVGEALNNTLKHAGSGTYQVFRRDDVVQAVVSDHGPGIDFRTLPRATLIPGFSTVATLGMGFTIMLQLCDRVLLATGPHGTTLVLELAASPSAEEALAERRVGVSAR